METTETTEMIYDEEFELRKPFHFKKWKLAFLKNKEKETKKRRKEERIKKQFFFLKELFFVV